MNINSDDWQVVGSTVYRLFTDKSGERCNEFTIQISCNFEGNPRERDDLAVKIKHLLNKEKLT